MFREHILFTLLRSSTCESNQIIGNERIIVTSIFETAWYNARFQAQKETQGHPSSRRCS
jgi:hypothetical protein